MADETHDEQDEQDAQDRDVLDPQPEDALTAPADADLEAEPDRTEDAPTDPPADDQATELADDAPSEVWDALNEPRPDLAGPVENDDESPLAAAAAAELARAEAIQQARADAIDEDPEAPEEPEEPVHSPPATDEAPGESDSAPADEPVAPAASDDLAEAEGEDDAVAAAWSEPEVEGDAVAATSSEPEVAAAPASASPWSVLGRALKPRATRAQVLAGVLCALLGFALVVQVRQASGADLHTMRQADLVRILDEVTNRSDTLANESAELSRERDELLSGSDRRQAALDALRRSAETQGILTGRLPAEGPGVVVTLTEPEGAIKPSTMLNMLEELRNAGAEAVELNDQRITASSAFTGTAGNIVLDGTPLRAPYVWNAIGDPDIIAPALNIPGGAMAQVRNNGGRGSVEPQEKLQIDALRVLPDPTYATPMPPSDG